MKEEELKNILIEYYSNQLVVSDTLYPQSRCNEEGIQEMKILSYEIFKKVLTGISDVAFCSLLSICSDIEYQESDYKVAAFFDFCSENNIKFLPMEDEKY